MGKGYNSSFGAVFPCATRPEFSRYRLPFVAIVPIESNALKAIYDSDLERRVCFYRNSDGTFGFLEWCFCDKADSWVQLESAKVLD
jgi:hypothetical protein